MFRIAQESWVNAPGRLIQIEPTANCVPGIIALAQAADLTVYPGAYCTPIYVECPEDEMDYATFMLLARAAGLTASMCSDTAN